MGDQRESWATRAGVGLLAMAVMLCVMFGSLFEGSALQQSILPWPARPIGPDGAVRRSGWYIAQGFGWMESGQETIFHDGLRIMSPNGDCPFGPRCETVAATDGVIASIGMDERRGQTVLLVNGDGQYEMLYGQLESYYHYVALEGRVDDPYGRYPEWSDYAPIGEDPLIPGAESVEISIACGAFGPTFTLVEAGAVSSFLHDAPAQNCVTSVTWGARDDDWDGWIPESPTSLRWRTEVVGEGWNARAMDVGVRFRAAVRPPPPPPTPTPTPTLPETPSLLDGDAGRSTSRVFKASFSVGDSYRLPMGLSVGDSCRPSETACRWSIPAQAFTRPQRAVENDPSPVVVVSVDGPPSIGPGETNGLTVVVTSSRYPVTIQARGDDGLRIDTVFPLTGECRRLSNESVQCMSAPEESYGAVVLRVVVRLDAAAPSAGMRTVRIDASHAGGTGSGSASLALRARATPTAAPYPPPSAPTPPGGGDLPADIPLIEITPTPISAPPPVRRDCAPQRLVQLPGVVNASGGVGNMRLVERAALSFQLVRDEIRRRTGKDPLQRLADGLRAPEFRSSKPGVALYSWHMTGRAIDVDVGYPWRRVRDGAKWRLYVDGVDVTEIFERHGWRRIPDRADSLEWWHYEFTEGLSWRAAMRQVWPEARLQNAFPEINWSAVGCTSVDETDGTLVLAEAPDRCTRQRPSFASDISSAAGCGPPVRVGDRVRQLTDAVGFIAGPGLFFGIRTSGTQGTDVINVCSPTWLAGLPPPTDRQQCWTDMANPAEFLPFDDEGNPMQLSPPEQTQDYVFGPAQPPSGMYWSPNWVDGPYGGGRSGGSW